MQRASVVAALAALALSGCTVTAEIPDPVVKNMSNEKLDGPLKVFVPKNMNQTTIKMEQGSLTVIIPVGQSIVKNIPKQFGDLSDKVDLETYEGERPKPTFEGYAYALYVYDVSGRSTHKEVPLVPNRDDCEVNLRAKTLAKGGKDMDDFGLKGTGDESEGVTGTVQEACGAACSHALSEIFGSLKSRVVLCKTEAKEKK